MLDASGTGTGPRAGQHGPEPLTPVAAQARAAWQRYVATGELVAELLREPILRAWRRCQGHAVDPRAMAARRLSASETGELIERSRDLLDAARPYLRALSHAAGGERHAAMLADARAIVLDIVADEETAQRTPGFPQPGSVRSEEVAGANGIGTALAEDGYVELVGPEHFIEGFHVYTCQGLPLRDIDGQVVGVLSTSVRRVLAAARLHEILICAAHGIEAELAHRRLAREVAEVLRERGAEGSRLETLRQDVCQLQAAARLRIETAARVAHTHPADALELVSAADQLIARFRRRAELWRDIAFEELGMPQPLDLRARLNELAELLMTEAAIRQIRLRVPVGPPVTVVTDSRELSRVLFRCLLRALDVATPGAVVEARVDTDAEDHQARISFSVPAGLALAFALADEPPGATS